MTSNQKATSSEVYFAFTTSSSPSPARVPEMANLRAGVGVAWVARFFCHGDAFDLNPNKANVSEIVCQVFHASGCGRIHPRVPLLDWALNFLGRHMF